MLLLSYLKDQLRKTRFAMSNPSITPGTLRYLKARESAIISKIMEHPEHDGGTI